MVASTSSAGCRIWIGVEEFSRSRVREPEGWPERAFQLTARSASVVVEGGEAAKIQWPDT